MAVRDTWQANSTGIRPIIHATASQPHDLTAGARYGVLLAAHCWARDSSFRLAALLDASRSH